MVEEAFVPIEGVAKHFSVSISTVRTWIRHDLIPSLKIGGVYRFKLSEVEQALRSIGGGELPEIAEKEIKEEVNFDVDEDF